MKILINLELLSFMAVFIMQIIHKKSGPADKLLIH